MASLAPELRAPAFDRHHGAAGWSREVLAHARVLVAGAGALGNESLKNLALVGVGTLGVLDRDRVEPANLARSVLFRSTDLGRQKATAAVERLTELNPRVRSTALALDLTCDLGEGTIAGYDLVLGCLDGIEARWRLNRLCRAAGVSLIDAGIDAGMRLAGREPAAVGQIAKFCGHGGPCYECSMTAGMWARLEERRSCLAGEALAQPSSATTATLAAAVAALQVQEAVAELHGRPGLAGGDSLTLSLNPYTMTLRHGRRNPECLAHGDAREEVCEVAARPAEITVAELLRSTGMTMLELGWDVVLGLTCAGCGVWPGCVPWFSLRREQLACPRCGRERTPERVSRIRSGDSLAGETLAALGVPERAYLSLSGLASRARVQCRLRPGRSVRWS